MTSSLELRKQPVRKVMLGPGLPVGRRSTGPRCPRCSGNTIPSAQGMTTDSGIWTRSSEFLRTPKANPVGHMAGVFGAGLSWLETLHSLLV